MRSSSYAYDKDSLMSLLLGISKTLLSSLTGKLTLLPTTAQPRLSHIFFKSALSVNNILAKSLYDIVV